MSNPNPMNQSPFGNDGLPEVVRVRAQKGFRGLINGKFGTAHPGDVVEVPKALAYELRGAGKAVMTKEELRQQKQYLPERKVNPPAPNDPHAKQLAALTGAVESLQKAVDALIAMASAKGGK